MLSSISIGSLSLKLRKAKPIGYMALLALYPYDYENAHAPTPAASLPCKCLNVTPYNAGLQTAHKSKTYIVNAIPQNP